MFPYRNLRIHDEPYLIGQSNGESLTNGYKSAGSLRDGDMLLLATMRGRLAAEQHEEGDHYEVALPEAEYARELCRNDRLRPQK